MSTVSAASTSTRSSLCRKTSSVATLVKPSVSSSAAPTGTIGRLPIGEPSGTATATTTTQKRTSMALHSPLTRRGAIPSLSSMLWRQNTPPSAFRTKVCRVFALKCYFKPKTGCIYFDLMTQVISYIFVGSKPMRM